MKGFTARSDAETSARPGDRVEWLDYARGIGIIMVVLGHVIRGLRVELVGPRLLDYELVNRLIYSFHMPLFFFLSGLLFAKTSSIQWQSFTKITAIRVIVPYVIWSVMFVALQAMASHGVNNPHGIGALLNIWRHPIGHMWFLYALFVVSVVNYLALRCAPRLGVVMVGAAFAFAYLIPGLLPWIDALAPGVAMGGTFFFLGLLLASVEALFNSPVQSRTAAVLALSVWAGTMVASRNGWAQVLLMPIAAVAGIAMIVTACRVLKDVRGPFTAMLGLFGQCSIAIFVAHTIFAAAFRILLYRAGIFNCDLHIVLGTLIGLAGPVGLFVLASKYKVGPFVGLGRSQSMHYLRVRTGLATW